MGLTWKNAKIRSNLYEGMFVFEAQTTEADETFTLPLADEETHDFTVDWGDGSTSEIASFDSADKVHTYTSPGTHEVKITGTIGGWAFNGAGDKDKISDIKNWGPFSFISTGSFKGCTNLQITATDGPNVLNLAEAFEGCTSLTDVDVSKWDTSSTVDARAAFKDAIGAILKGLFFWKIQAILYASKFLYNATLPTVEYDRVLTNWALQPRQSGVGFNFGNSQYTVTKPSRLGKKILVEQDNWKISDQTDGPTLDYADDWDLVKVLGFRPIDVIEHQGKVYVSNEDASLYEFDPETGLATQVAGNASTSYYERVFSNGSDIFFLRMVQGSRLYRWTGSGWATAYAGSADGGSYCVDNTGFYIGRSNEISSWTGSVFTKTALTLDMSLSGTSHPDVVGLHKDEENVIHAITSSGFDRNKFAYYSGAGPHLNYKCTIDTGRSFYDYFSLVFYDGVLFVTAVGGDLYKYNEDTNTFDLLISPASSWADYRNVWNIVSLVSHPDGRMYALRQNGQFVRLSEGQNSWEIMAPSRSIHNGGDYRKSKLIILGQDMYGVIRSGYSETSLLKYAIEEV